MAGRFLKFVRLSVLSSFLHYCCLFACLPVRVPVCLLGCLSVYLSTYCFAEDTG